jgi:uncharacterized protein YndB with AHSA1/START domain
MPISDEAVKKATGRGWTEWLKLLDKAGAKKLAHGEIAAIVSEQFGAPPWWSQMVTVTYERERGLREVHQTPSGFQASVSRTFAVPVDELFDAWSDAKRRKSWLRAAKITVRKSTPNKSIRLTWSDGTNVEAGFYAKGDAKSQVAVQHSKLADKEDVAAKKALWSEALTRLREQLES